MSSIPQSPRPAVASWAQAHIVPWSSSPAQIGLTSDFASEFAASVLAYQQAEAASQAAQQAAQAASRASAAAYATLRRNMTAGVTTIRAFAVRQVNPQAVYDRAQVPPRAAAAPLPPPGRPSELGVELLDATGALQLRWKCDNPQGAAGNTYIIRRRLPGEASFSVIGVSGEKRFVDSTFAAGPDRVEYTVQAYRAERAGTESAIFTINFGTAVRRSAPQETTNSDRQAA